VKHTVIFGCGYHGRAVYRILKKKNHSISNWIDNDKQKYFKKLFNIPILPVKNLDKIKFNKIIFSGRDIKEQLLQYNKMLLPKSKIQIWDTFKLTQPKKLLEKREKCSEKILKKIVNILNKKKIFYWVDGSGLLQLLRDKRTSNLSDFDLSFDNKDHLKVIKTFKTNSNFTVIKKKLSKSKWKIFIISNNNYKQYEPVCIDFHFKKKNKEFMVDAFNLKKKIPIKFFKDFVNFKFDDNLNLVIPKNSISYLEYLYGKERWKKREKFFKNPLAKKNRPFLGPIDN
jgi:hypothetical protein